MVNSEMLKLFANTFKKRPLLLLERKKVLFIPAPTTVMLSVVTDNPNSVVTPE